MGEVDDASPRVDEFGGCQMSLYYCGAKRSRLGSLLAGTILSSVLGTAAFGQMLLPAIEVEGHEKSAQTEGTNSYTTSVTTVGKDAVPLRQLPQSVTVVTRQRIEDQNMQSLEDAARVAPGVVIFQNDRGRSSIFSRGFEFDTFSIDGMPAPLSSIYGTQPDLAPFDRVEVLRGPSGLFAGTGEPAGSLNLARKRAQSKASASVNGTAGSWDFYRTEVDVTGPLTKSGNVRARAVGAFTDNNSFVDYAGTQSKAGYGTIEVDLTPQTTASFVVLHQDKDIVPQNGLPTYADGRLPDVSRSTFSGRSWNRFENKVDDYMAELEHRFDNGGHAKAAIRYSDRFADMKYAYGAGAINSTTGDYSSRILARKYWEKSLSADAHVSTPFSLIGQTHNLIAGVDYRRYDQTLHQGTATDGTNNIFNPNPNTAEPALALTPLTQVKPTETGVYSQLRFKPVSALTAIVGGRMSWYEQDTTTLSTGAVASLNQTAVTPYYGLIVDLTPNISAYGIYTEIFQPQPGSLTVSGSNVDPRTGEQYEAGFKGSFFGGAVNASIAYFVTRDKNRAVRDLANPTFVVAAGEAEVSGIEAEVSGQLTAGWQVQAGYAFTESRYLKTVVAGGGGGTTYNAGDTFSTGTPKHSFNLWSKYEFQDVTWRGLHVAAGIRAMSEFYAQASPTVRIVEGGYSVIDAQIGYKFNDHLSATFTINNLFDEIYFARTGAVSTFNMYGEPRSFWFKLAAKT